MPVSAKSWVASSTSSDSVIGPPTTATVIAAMPITAASLGSTGLAPGMSAISPAKIWPTSDPRNSDAKNSPPRKPNASDTAEASD